jgi:deoxyhypusine synthase
LPTQIGMNAPKGISKEALLPGHGDALGLDLERTDLGPVGRFLCKNFLHFNAGTVVDAAQAYCALLDQKGKGLLAMAGAMSTAELGISLAEMIRKDKIHAISCTAANLEEDLFNLIARSKYLRLPGYSALSAEDDEMLGEVGLPRVTDTAIPEKAAMKVIEEIVKEFWQEADAAGESYFPHEYLYRAIRDGRLEDDYDIDPKNSWMVAASKKNLPIFVPGFEDSTLGNMFASLVIKGEISDSRCMKSGIDYMVELADWYQKNCDGAGIGFIELGGGLAADFSICVVPMLKVDLGLDEKIPFWSFYLQVCDAHTSYGGYSGASPNEKLSWQKLEPSTPRFSIQSDATVIAPLLFAYVLGW